MNKKHKQLLIFAVITVALVGLMSGAFQLSVLSVSTLNIDPQGYEDPVSHEWRGSFWSVVMTTDFDDQICAFMLSTDDDHSPEDTFALTGNEYGLGEKVYASAYTVGGNQLVPTQEIMVHITPRKPYYERPMEIQQGYYYKDTYATGESRLGGKYQLTGTKINGQQFIHYSYADVGGGNWVLHTPFLVKVYKNGIEIASQEIDSTGTSQVYRLPTTGDEFINVIDLGKLDVSGYGQPDWGDDILYFNKNNIFTKSPTADNLLKYDGGETPSGTTFGSVTENCFNSYWFGSMRWISDGSPAAVKDDILYPLVGNNDFPGWYREDNALEFIAKPRQPDVFGNVIPYLQDKGIQRVNLPTGFDSMEMTADEHLRVYFDYGTKASLLTIKISTELADTIVWQPQVANFEITSFPDFGDVADVKTVPVTVTCLEGSGSAQVSFTKNPLNAPFSITPIIGTPILTTGESYTFDISIQNLGTPNPVDFSVEANVRNALGSVTDTDSANGRLLAKTGATTIVNVITQYEGNPISNLPVTLFYAGTSQTKTTGQNGLGTATFNLGESGDLQVKADFAGNSYYLPASQTKTAKGGSETTITLSLQTEITVPGNDWILWMILGLGSMMTVVVLFYIWRRKH